MNKNPFDDQKPIPGVPKVLAVSSGKGGVGKSTISAHLALALNELGLKVGLLDADIYGPSLPRMFGTMGKKPDIEGRSIQPLTVGHIKTMSIGNLVDDDLAVVWRGPMLFKAIQQFLFEVSWAPLDILVIDLPPGTGDVQLSLAQKTPIDGAISVSMPQNLSLSDVKKSMDMFDRVNVPVIGLVENMAYFTDSNGDKVSLFAKGELDTYIESQNIKKLAQVPLFPELGQACELGVHLAFKQKQPYYEVFMSLAKEVQAVLKI